MKMKKILSLVVGAAIAVTSLTAVSPVGAEAEPPSLRADSALIYTKAGDAVCGTNGAITAEALAAEFDSAVTVKKADGTVLEGGKKVPTGSVVASESGSVPVLISGDANVDGNINLADVSAMLKVIAKWDTAIDMTAAMVTGGAKLSLGDVSAILKFIAGWDVRLGSVKIVVNEEPVAAAAEDQYTRLWADHATAKYSRTEVVPTDNFTYVINAAKNEAEGATLFISPGTEKTAVTVSATDFVNCYGDRVETEAFTMFYTLMGEWGYMPDFLMPVDSTYEAKVKADESQGFYIRATTTKDTAPGLYESTVSIMSEGTEFKRAKLYLFVWDFTLDDRDAPRSSFGIDKNVAASHAIDGVKDPEAYLGMYKKYYDMLLDNRICAYTLPYNVEDAAADVYLNDPRVNSFVVYGEGYGGNMDCTLEQLALRYEKLSPNEDWFNKAYFYVVDEPYDAKNDQQVSSGAMGVYKQMQYTRELIDTRFPGGKQVVPLETGTHITLYDGFMDYYRETVDILCPKTYAFAPVESFSDELGNGDVWAFENTEISRDYGSYIEYAERCTAEDESKESWWYFAGLPAEPFTTYHATADGMYVRMSGWQMYALDVTGVLYYSVTDYRGKNPLYNVEYMTGVGVAAYGNGVMLASGMRQGVDGPVGSVRLDYIRDSFEDYMYLAMAERVIGKDATDRILSELVRDFVDFETDADVMLQVRADLAEAIVSAQAE